MEQEKNKMAISELSSCSGSPVSTIKFYLREGLLPKPVKTGETRAYYSLRHLDRLKLIQKIQKESKLPLQKIIEIIRLIDTGEERERRDNEKQVSKHRTRIVRTATSLFQEKGYESVTIAQIVEAARIGRSTFYKNFQNKKELFVECIQKIILREGVPDDREEIGESNGFTVFDKSAEAYFREGTLWRDMIRRLRAAAINDPEEFEDILEKAMQLKINLFRKRIETSVQEGFMRELNPTLLAAMILGVQDYCSEYITKGLFREPPKVIFEQVKDILLHGIVEKERA